MKSQTIHQILLICLISIAVVATLMTMPIPVAARPPLGISMDDGTVSLPAFNFSSDPDTGIYRKGTNNLGFTAGGTNILDVTGTGFFVGGGYGSTGCTIGGTTGNLECDGQGTFGSGVIANTGLTVVNGTAAFEDVTTDYVTSTNPISMGGATFTGPLKYGTSATYTSGASITHGFATTPTVCLLWPVEVTATVTITPTGFSSDTATHSNPIYWVCGK